MRTRFSVRIRVVAFIAVAALAGAPPLAAAEQRPDSCSEAKTEEPSPRADCCFSNRAFSGVCVVQPEGEETCATILAYLNNPQSQGKDYCGKTTIRGGWQQTACEAPQAGQPVEGSRR
jgi:hypothetical protein